MVTTPRRSFGASVSPRWPWWPSCGFRSQSARRTATSILVLCLFGLLAMLTLHLFSVSFTEPPPPGPDQPPPPGLDQPPSPGPDQLPKSSPTFEPPPTPSFDGHDWQKDPAPLAIVTLHDDVAPWEAGYYFRETAFSEFHDHRFWRSPLNRDVPERFSDDPLSVTDVSSAAEDSLVRSTVSLLAPLPLPLGLVSPTRFEPLANADPAQFVKTYGVTSRVSRFRGINLYELPAGNPHWSEAERRHYLVGSPDPRYAELAAKINGTIDRATSRRNTRILHS